MKIQLRQKINLLAVCCLAFSAASVYSQPAFSKAEVKAIANQVGQEKSTTCTLASAYMQNEFMATKPNPMNSNGLDYGPVPKYDLKLGMTANILKETYEALATQFVSPKKIAELQTEYDTKTTDEAFNDYKVCITEAKKPYLNPFFNYTARRIVPRVSGTMR